MVDNPSARITADGATSYPQIPGYEPSRFSFSNGRMILMPQMVSPLQKMAPVQEQVQMLTLK